MDCAKGRFGFRSLPDQHVAQRRLKVGAAAAAVNMMTFGAARMSRERRTLSLYQLRTSQAKRRVASVVIVMLSPQQTTLSLECEMVRSEQSLSIPATCRTQFALLESITILEQCPKTVGCSKRLAFRLGSSRASPCTRSQVSFSWPNRQLPRLRSPFFALTSQNLWLRKLEYGYGSLHL